MRPLFVALLTAVAALANAGGNPDQKEAPAESAATIVATACATCHDISVVTQTKLNQAGWELVINDMLSRGAPLTDEQIPVVIEYLAKTHGPESE